MVKPIAEQPSRSASCTEPVIAWSFAVARLLELLSFRISGIWPAKVSAPGLDHAEHRGIGREPGIERELEVIVRIIGRRVGREAARRAMLEALIHRQDHQPAGAAEPPLHQDAGEIGLGARIVALVIGQDLADPRASSSWRWFP